jgi:biotin carboxyl carrier protein
VDSGDCRGPCCRLHLPTGEELWVDERLVLAPRMGRLTLGSQESRVAEGDDIVAGQVVAFVLAPDGELVPVRSSFSGRAIGFLVPAGAPVKLSEPVFWLRKHGC